MLFTKRFYCLFPLVCNVLHSMMFSMVRAAPMNNLAGYGDNLKVTDPLSRLIDEDYNESHDHGYDDALQEKIDSFYNVLNGVPDSASSSSHPMSLGQAEKGLESMVNYSATKEEIEKLSKWIKQFKPLRSMLESYMVNRQKKRYPNLLDGGQNVLKEFFTKSSQPSTVGDVSGLEEVVPMFSSNNQIYFLAKLGDDQPFLLFSKPLGIQHARMYGTIQPNVSQRINNWPKDRAL